MDIKTHAILPNKVAVLVNNTRKHLFWAEPPDVHHQQAVGVSKREAISHLGVAAKI